VKYEALEWLNNFRLFHIALYDIKDEGKFKWCLGNYSLPLKKDTLLKFAAGEPNNMDGNDPENCAELKVVENHDRELQINDAYCEKLSPFICEVMFTKYGNDPYLPYCHSYHKTLQHVVKIRTT